MSASRPPTWSARASRPGSAMSAAQAQERNGPIEQNAQEAEILSLALERKKREARADHLAATSLDRTRAGAQTA